MSDETPKEPAWVRPFLATLAATGRVNKATKAAGISTCALYHRRKTNLRFAEEWQAVLEQHRAQEAACTPVREPKEPRVRSGGWRGPFLDALAETSNITASAIRANVPLRTVYKARRADAAFAANWQLALHEGYDMLEMELLGYLRDPQPQRKMDVAAALRLLAAHRETVERRRALTEEDDEQAVLESIDQFIEDMRQRRLANSAILIAAEVDGETDRGPQ
jgi:hypothetical protein